MGAPPKTKLAALKFFTSHQLTGSNGIFLAMKSRHMSTIFRKGLHVVQSCLNSACCCASVVLGNHSSLGFPEVASPKQSGS